ALNFTGGNKLMATAAFRWAVRRGVRSFYLERGRRLTWFIPSDGDVATSTEDIDPSVANVCDAVALLRCQLDASEVEREGQRLVLSPKGLETPPERLFELLRNGADPEPFLHMDQSLHEPAKEGDRLELQAAATLLKLGV